MTWDLAIQLVVGLGGLTALIGLLKVRADKKKILAEASKTGADAAQVVAQTAIGLLGPYSEQVTMLTRRLTEASNQIDELTTRLREANQRVGALEHQVQELTNELDWFRRGEAAGYERVD
jgi:flagellar biosynthesis/type III secretory pathway chaperone